jgi:hypothetical protein
MPKQNRSKSARNNRRAWIARLVRENQQASLISSGSSAVSLVQQENQQLNQLLAQQQQFQQQQQRQLQRQQYQIEQLQQQTRAAAREQVQFQSQLVKLRRSFWETKWDATKNRWELESLIMNQMSEMSELQTENERLR